MSDEPRGEIEANLKRKCIPLPPLSTVPALIVDKKGLQREDRPRDCSGGKKRLRLIVFSIVAVFGLIAIGWAVIQQKGLVLKSSDYQAAYRDGFAQFRNAAEAGDAEAQYCLGERYRIGLGVPKDPVEAVRWFLKSAEQDHIQAQTTLGLIYSNGQGLPKNRKEAFRWYRRAAIQGNAMAQAELGMLYRYGYEDNGAGRNLDQALLWLQKGAEAGDQLAQQGLSFMLRWGMGVSVDTAKAEE